MERRYALQANGYDFDTVVAQVARALGMDSGAVLGHAKDPQTVKARSLLCYWANRELGMSTVELSHRLRISQSAVSRASLRGEKIATKSNLHL